MIVRCTVHSSRSILFNSESVGCAHNDRLTHSRLVDTGQSLTVFDSVPMMKTVYM